MNIKDSVGTAFSRACQDRLSSSIGKGISKHELRQEAISSGSERHSSGLLHADTTINNYAGIAARYAEWMKNTHPDCTRLKIAHRRKYDHEYIQSLIDRGLSPSTIKTYTAALSFLHNCTMKEIHSERPIVQPKDATRCRYYSEQVYQEQLSKCEKNRNENLATILRLCRITGLRKDEARQISPENFSWTKNGMLCHLTGTNKAHHLHPDESNVHTKGGRERTIEILPRYEAELIDILSHTEAHTPICPHIPNDVNIHGIRALYASEMYQAFARPIADIPVHERTMENGKDLPSRYVDKDGNTWDRRALLRTAASLGHSRSNVVVQSYLWILG